MTDLLKNMNAERRQVELLLCSMALVDQETVRHDCSWVLPDLFYDEKLREYWKRVMEGDEPVDAAMKLGIMNEILNSSRDYIPGKHDTYASRISELYYMRNAYESARNIVDAVGKNNIQEVERIVDSMPTVTSGGRKGAYTPEEISDQFITTITNVMPSVFTGIKSLDRYGALYPQELIVLAARTGVGKTALCLQIARSVAWGGKKVLFFSLEMSREQLWARMACPLAGVEWKDVRAGLLGQNEIEKLIEKSDELNESLNNNLLVHDECWTLQEMHRISLMHKPDLVIIDQLPDIVWHDPAEPELTWYGKAVKYLRQYIARGMDIPVILIHQLSRSPDTRNDKRPQLSDLRMSGEVEQRADIVWMLYREDYYSGREADQNVVPFEILVRKNRQGVQDVQIILNYDLKSQWFTSPDSIVTSSSIPQKQVSVIEDEEPPLWWSGDDE